jgi:ATP synthase protein I
VTGQPPEDRHRRFGRTIGRKAARRIRARHETDSAWFWLGMLGMIGWSVAIPTLLGVLVGMWLDRVAPAPFSWVLSLIVVGLVLGSVNAWFWVRRESPGDRATEDEDPARPGPYGEEND